MNDNCDGGGGDMRGARDCVRICHDDTNPCRKISMLKAERKNLEARATEPSVNAKIYCIVVAKTTDSSTAA